MRLPCVHHRGCHISLASPERAGIFTTMIRTAFVLALALIAQQPAAPPAPAAAPEKAPEALPPLPPDAHVEQTMQLAGRALKYTATVGTIPVYSADGAKKTGEVVFTSFVMDGADRPVTFAFNGGPGASSVYLDLGAIGPKRVQFGDEGDSPSEIGRAHV